MAPGILLAATLAAHFVSPLVKVRPGQPPPEVDGRLSLARNECEGIQVFLPPGLEPTRVELPAALEGPDGAKLPLVGYQARWIRVTRPSNSAGGTGLWADPLVPLSDKPVRSTKKEPGLLYLEVCAPEAQRPGTYGASVRLMQGQQVKSLALKATVQPFAIPATSSLPNTFGISLYSIAKGHGIDSETPEARALLAEYVRELLRHRVSAHGMDMTPPPVRFERGVAKVDFEAWDRELLPFLSGTALPSGARFTTLQLHDLGKSSTEAEKSAYLRAVRAHLDAKGFSGDVFFYAKDEPRPEDYPLVRAQSRAVRGAKGVRTLVTSAFDRRLAPEADILAPPLNCFFERSGPQTCTAPMSAAALRKKLGRDKRVYWYQSCLAHGCADTPIHDPKVERAYTGWASYMLDHPAPLNRAMGPLAFIAGVDGELYFNTVMAFHNGDPWESIWAFGGNGDGTFFYPGTPERLGVQRHAPVTSLRLKHLRDGLEDYEYLRLLEQRGQGKAAREWVRRLAKSGYEITLDPGEWAAVREGLTRAINARE